MPEIVLKGSFWRSHTDYLGDSKITFQFPKSELEKVTEIAKDCVEKPLKVRVKIDETSGRDSNEAQDKGCQDL